MIEKFEKALECENFDYIKSELPLLLKNYKKTIKRFNKILDQADAQQFEVIKLAEKLKNLLDNTNQGFLQFDDSMKIDSEYSKQVKIIFGQEVKHKNITKLLYSDDTKALKLQENLLYILDNPDQAEIILSLFEKEFVINNRFIQIEYKILPDRNIMLILTDVTEKKELEEVAKTEKRILKMVVEVVVNKEETLNLIKDYRNFVNNIPFLDENKIKMEIHTFKGLFSQKEFVNLPLALNTIESTLNFNQENLLEFLNRDIEILENILGKEFFNVNYVLIDKDRLNYVIEKIKKYTQDTKITDLIEGLNDFNLKNYFRKYRNLLNQLSIRFEKPIKMDFEIEDIYLNNRFKPFLDSLIHVFRNAMDHGIESMEERIINDKDEFGYIKCKVYQSNNHLKIEIQDDGRGIDIEKIKSKILKKQLLPKSEIDKLSLNEIANFIFEENFSTKDEVSIISGRGIGLSVVKNEVEKLNGSIKLTYNPTKFVFDVPFKN